LLKQERWFEQLKENGEAFLSEVLIMGKRFSNVSFAHCVHGDAVGEAIALVGASFIEGQSSNKALMSMARDFGIGVSENFFSRGNRSSPSFFTMLGKKVQYFNQDDIGCDQSNVMQQGFGRVGWTTPLIVWVNQCDPVIRVCEH
jgi:hypothetical protein